MCFTVEFWVKVISVRGKITNFVQILIRRREILYKDLKIN